MRRSLLLSFTLASSVASLSNDATPPTTRRQAIGWLTGTVAASVPFVGNNHQIAWAESGESSTPDTFDVDNFLRSGMVSQPMGVSGQSGKSRPETGVILREGSDVSRDPRSGDVLAEILVKPFNAPKGSSEKVSVLATYASPWPLATGSVFDVECRDPNTGDGAFLAVTSSTNGKSSVSDIKDSFFVDSLFRPSGRFSSYGSPTDIKVKKSWVDTEKNYKTLDISFSTLSQSTQTEIPRRARLVATIPSGSDQAVMLVSSTSALRWKKGSVEDVVAKVSESFSAVPAPKTSMKVRAKQRGSSSLDLSDAEYEESS